MAPPAAAVPGILAVGAIAAAAIGDAPDASAAADVSGMAVFLDPGHSGANDASISRQVPNGRGGMKDCQTTGTATSDGYPEHSFNYDVVQQINPSCSPRGFAPNYPATMTTP